jgi:predicted AAA+ superfamily ATPase
MELESTRDREFGVYKRINDNFPKYVISMDQVDFSRDGIVHMHIEDFLLNG